MRPKKDPGIRQEAFVKAAKALFMEKGYEAVSIRDVLDAVADRTASPSVFYYYFQSKDALYRTCVQGVAREYLSSMRDGFSVQGKTREEWMCSLVTAMEGFLQSENNLIRTGSSTANRLFILDMRDQVTREITALWEESLTGLFSLPEGEAHRMTQFLAGGISEMMFGYLTEEIREREKPRAFSERIVRLVMNTMGLPETEKAALLEALHLMYENS